MNESATTRISRFSFSQPEEKGEQLRAPFLHVHVSGTDGSGDRDPHVPGERVQKSADILEGTGGVHNGKASRRSAAKKSDLRGNSSTGPLGRRDCIPLRGTHPFSKSAANALKGDMERFF
jgi:hypothetical protein